MRAPQSAKTMFVDGEWYLIETPDSGKFLGCQAYQDNTEWGLEYVTQNEGMYVVLFNKKGVIVEVIQTEKPKSWWDEISANILAYNGQVAYFEPSNSEELGPSPTIVAF